MYHRQEHPQAKIYDQDIEHLKSLISKLVVNKQEVKMRSEESDRIARIQQENKDLSFRIASLTQQNKELIRQLLNERQQNTRLKASLSQINKSSFSKPYNQAQISLQSKYIESLSPSDQKIYETQIINPSSFSPLKQSQSSTFNRDQLYRLNSYLIQYNTNIKLLIEKYNYLAKLRGLSFPSDTQQVKILNQTNIILSNRKTIEQAKSILKTSRKKYFDSESSSDIQDQCNQIEQMA